MKHPSALLYAHNTQLIYMISCVSNAFFIRTSRYLNFETIHEPDQVAAHRITAQKFCELTTQKQPYCHFLNPNKSVKKVKNFGKFFGEKTQPEHN